MKVQAPRTEAELMQRAEALAGMSLAEIAQPLFWAVPPDLRRHKGWIGQLIEAALGATAGSRAQPDFPQLGIEMKTLPLDARGEPRESTFVCTAPLDGSLARTWEESWLRRKLSRVLWVPILGEGPPGERRVARPLLWSPSPEEEAQLQADWTELTDLIGTGAFWEIDGRRGHVLQLRPKAASAESHTWTLDEEGNPIAEHPRGFYLRTRFTRALVERYYF